MISIQTQIETLKRIKQAATDGKITAICSYIDDKGNKCPIGYLLDENKLKFLEYSEELDAYAPDLIGREFITEEEIGLNRYLAYRIQVIYDYYGASPQFINFLQSEIEGDKSEYIRLMNGISRALI